MVQVVPTVRPNVPIDGFRAVPKLQGDCTAALISSEDMMAKSARMERIEAMLADDPTDAFLRYSLGMEYVSLGDDATAVSVFRELIAQDPTAAGAVPAYHMAGQALNRLGQIDQACDMLRAGIAAAAKVGDSHARGEMEGLLGSIE
jgi:tetratricopeptide (TPR) repeat protein